MRASVSRGKRIGVVFFGMALLVLGLNATVLRADGPPAPPEITYQILNFWFFRATNNFATVRGDAPLTATNLMATTNAWSRGAVRVMTNNALLKYRETATNATRAWTNLLVDEGCLRFWFRNHWQSSSLGGTGPGTYARLIEVGDSSATNGYWTLYFHPAGTNLYFASTTNGAVGGVYLSAPIQWASNYWHLITLNYSRSNCQLFIDGQMVSTNTGLARWPGPNARTNGFTLGGDCRATNLVKGDISDLVTCRGYFSPESATNTFENMASYYPLGPDGGQSLLWQGGEENAMLLSGMGGELESQGFYVSTNQGLTLLLLHQETNVVLAVTNGEAGVFYDLYRSTSLSGTSLVSSPWLALARLTNGEPYTDTNDALAFYILGDATNDLDGDGLTDAFEALVSKSDRNNPDSDADGLSDYYEVYVSGTSPVLADSYGDGTSDAYRDFDGDGWYNIDENRNGTNPYQYDVPPSLNLDVDFVWGSSNATLRWNPAPGSVVGYVIRRWIPESWEETFFTNFSAATMFTDTSFPQIALNQWYYDMAVYEPTYQVMPFYAATNGPWDTSVSLCSSTVNVKGYIFRGSQGKSYLLLPAIPTNTVTIRITPSSLGSFDVPISSITNGVLAIPDAWTPGFPAADQYLVQAIDSLGQISRVINVGYGITTPFFDGREQLKDNLAFMVRAAGANSNFWFLTRPYSGSLGLYGSTKDYAYVDYYNSPLGGTYAHPWEYRPFYLNYALSNFVYNRSNICDHWIADCEFAQLMTGVQFPVFYQPSFILNIPAQYEFPGFSSTNTIPSILSSNNTRWNRPFRATPTTSTANEIGVYDFGGNRWRMTNIAKNFYGLSFLSAKYAYASNWVLREYLLTPGTNRYYAEQGYFYPETAQPVFQTVGQYFCQSGIGPRPGDALFSLQQTNPLIFSGVGSQIQVAGYAKLIVQNGDTNKFAYLAQYFDKAYKVGTNGLVTSNLTGILSPYGEFVATEPGYSAVVTMPTWTGAPQATTTVYSIKVQLDVDHDGNMNSSFTGPDNTGLYRPYQFWVNNDHDRTNIVDGSDSEEDDLKPGESGFPQNSPYDCLYNDPVSGQPAIPCKRDLEDYARIHLLGFSRLATNLPSGYKMDLRWRNPAISPGINIFRATDAAGTASYLTDTNVAQAQIGANAVYVGSVSSFQCVDLTQRFADCTNDPSRRLGDYFIFCGSATGSGELVWRVLDQSSNLVTETSAFIEIKDIKNFYERWTCGEALSPGSGYSLAPLKKSVKEYSLPLPATERERDYILWVHGWNMQPWEKERWAEAAFKRLYWQGYQGRVGLFKWPTFYQTGSTFDDLAWDAKNFDESEYNAWRSGAALNHLFNYLQIRYPNRVRVLAHSMGNIVAGEALKLAGSTNLVHTYVASQAAIPAHCYDPNPAFNMTFEFNFDDGTPNAYAQYWTPGSMQYFFNLGGTENFANYYNANDWALAPTRWELDQKLKPDGVTLGYGYNVTSNLFLRGKTVLNFPTDTYEIFAFCDEARSHALGRQANVGGAFTVGSQVDLNTASYAFGDAHKGHSAQFRSFIALRGSYWRTLLTTFDIR